MKRTMLVILTLVLTAAFATTAFAGAHPNATVAAVNKALVEDNLIVGVQSQNFGLRTSAAMMLGDIKSTKAVFSLMHMLRTESDERARIVAALALTKIGDPVGLYAVKQTARLDSNERLRKLCGLFYQVSQATIEG